MGGDKRGAVLSLQCTVCLLFDSVPSLLFTFFFFFCNFFLSFYFLFYIKSLSFYSLFSPYILVIFFLLITSNLSSFTHLYQFRFTNSKNSFGFSCFLWIFLEISLIFFFLFKSMIKISIWTEYIEIYFIDLKKSYKN